MRLRQLISGAIATVALVAAGMATAADESVSEAAPATASPSARTAFNSLYLEAFGNGFFDSVNYDRMFGEHWSARVGFGMIVIDGNSYEFVPVVGNYLVGDGNHKLELGLGPLLVVGKAGSSDSGLKNSVVGTNKRVGLAGTATVGYRYAPQHGGLHFKIGLTPIFGSGGLLPSGGISFGGIF